MAGEIPLYVVGTLTGDPELTFLSSGKAVANFTIAQNPRTKDGNGWKDGEPTFLRCNAWEAMAENVVESLKKGDRVIVHGGMYTRPWEDKEGKKRSSLEVRVEAVGPDLRYATAAVTKVRRDSTGGGFAKAAPAADPWATSAGTTDPPF